MATLFIGQNKVFLPETESTNSYAINLLKNVKCFEGTVVYTHHQTAGRGQRGNSWQSEPSMNSTLSIIIKPDFLSAKNSFLLSKITALAVYDVLAVLIGHSQFDIKIKWPNDILVNKKKISGILIENQYQDEKLKWSVIGIGLNVNQTKFNEINASSLALITEKTNNPDEVNELIYKYFEKWYLILKQGRMEEVNIAYLNRLYGYNQLCKFSEKGQVFEATIKNVNELGLLELEINDGSIIHYDIKQLSFII